MCVSACETTTVRIFAKSGLQTVNFFLMNYLEPLIRDKQTPSFYSNFTKLKCQTQIPLRSFRLTLNKNKVDR